MRLEQKKKPHACTECGTKGPCVVIRADVFTPFGGDSESRLVRAVVDGDARVTEDSVSYGRNEAVEHGWRVISFFPRNKRPSKIVTRLCPVCIFKACELTAQLKDTWNGETPLK